jgi:hypothetical protein
MRSQYQPAGVATPRSNGNATLSTPGHHDGHHDRAHAPAPSRRAAVCGALALATIVLIVVLVVLEASAGPSILVPRSSETFPGWEAGPLGHLIPRLITNRFALQDALSAALGVLLVAYLVVLATVRTFSMRAIAVTVVGLHVILLLAPPMQLTDMFNYLGYARLGALHHLDPYTHSITAESFDPVFRLSSWHNLKSPYGELFTLLSYPLGLIGLAAAYWVVKVVTVALSLAFVWLVWWCARRLDVEPRAAVAFVALNPIFLIYAVGGFHNDFFMLVPMLGAIALVLRGRDRSAGACLMVAIAVKFTAILLGPFLLVALAANSRRRRLIEGAGIAFVPLLVVSLLAFGTALPNLSQQSTLLTNFSAPNLVGLIFGVGGSRTVLRVAEVLLVALVAYQLLRRTPSGSGPRARWLAGAGWSTVALILSLSWVVPWYVVWVLPLAVLSAGRGLRRACIVLTIWMLLTFAPATTQYMNDHDLSLLQITSAGRASLSLQHRLSN